MPSSSLEVLKFPTPELSADHADVVAMLLELVAEARAGQLDSLLVVHRNSEGGIGTRWTCPRGGSLEVAFHLDVLKFDILGSRE